MKNEVIPPDRLVISEGTSAGEVCGHVRVCVRDINYSPGALLFDYAIFQHILLESYDLFLY